MEAMRVTIMATVNTRADTQRSRCDMFCSCFFGPTRKHVAARAEMFPRVNMVMNEDLQPEDGVRNITSCASVLQDRHPSVRRDGWLPTPRCMEHSFMSVVLLTSAWLAAAGLFTVMCQVWQAVVLTTEHGWESRTS